MSSVYGYLFFVFFYFSWALSFLCSFINSNKGFQSNNAHTILWHIDMQVSLIDVPQTDYLMMKSIILVFLKNKYCKFAPADFSSCF